MELTTIKLIIATTAITILLIITIITASIPRNNLAVAIRKIPQQHK